MLPTYEASTPKLCSSFDFTRVRPRQRVGCVVTSLPLSSRSRLNSVRISLMIWCVPDDNKSSKWNTSDTRFVVWVHRQVCSGRSRTSRGYAPDGPAGVSVRSSDHKDFSVISRSLFACWDPVFPTATRVAALRIPRHRPSCALRKAVFMSAVNTV